MDSTRILVIEPPAQVERVEKLARILAECARPDNCEHQIWVEAGVIDRLNALRCPGESYSSVIARLVDLQTEPEALGWSALRQ